MRYLIYVMHVNVEIFDFFDLNFFNIGQFNRLSSKTLFSNISILSFGETCINICFFAESLERFKDTVSDLFRVIFSVLNLQFSIKFLFFLID